jgi:hypothetical protein
MVEPPRIQVQVDARQKAIPTLFARFCPEDKYDLEIVSPKKEKHSKPGPSKRPTFRILNKSGELVAYFNPWGNAECYKDDFQPLFDKIVKKIEKAAADALAKFKGH